MLPSSASRNSKGFTLTETLVIVAVIGILAAIAAPSFLALLNQKRVDNALATVRGALQEAQREAIRKSVTCSVNLPDGDSQTLTGNPTNCLVTGERKLEGTSLASNLATNPKRITFSFRGNTTSSGTVVLSVLDGSGQKRCLVISNGVGIMRTGTYNSSNSKCTTSQ